jgi:hypothetical protein
VELEKGVEELAAKDLLSAVRPVIKVVKTMKPTRTKKSKDILQTENQLMNNDSTRSF